MFWTKPFDLNWFPFIQWPRLSKAEFIFSTEIIRLSSESLTSCQNSGRNGEFIWLHYIALGTRHNKITTQLQSTYKLTVDTLNWAIMNMRLVYKFNDRIWIMEWNSWIYCVQYKICREIVNPTRILWLLFNRILYDINIFNLCLYCCCICCSYLLVKRK